MTAYIRSKAKREKTIHEDNDLPIRNSTSAAVKVLTTQEEFDEIEQEWNEFINDSQVDAHIFQTYDWQRLWWKNFGDGNDLQILTVWEDQKLVGLAPLFIEKTSIFGIYEYKKLKFIGSSVSDEDASSIFTDETFSYYLDLIIHPYYKEVVVDEFISYLKRTRTYVDSIEVDEISEESIMLNEVLLKIWQQGWQFDGELKETSTQIALSDAVENGLNGEMNAEKNKGQEEDFFSIRKVQNKEEIDSAFFEFLGLHQKQWNRRGYPGIFVNDKLKNFLREVTQVFAEKDNLKMSTAIDNNGNCVAVNLSFQFKDWIYNYQEAFDAEDAIESLTDFLIENAADSGVECVDLLKNNEGSQIHYTHQTMRNLQVTISGHASTNSTKKYLYRLVQTNNGIKNQLKKEWLVLKTHIRQWGMGKFLPRYVRFLKKRIPPFLDWRGI